MTRFRHLLVALALVATGAGCELIVRIDPSLLPGAGTGGGGGQGVATGTGGTSSASTGTSGTGGKGGTGGTSSSTTAGAGGGCSTAAECPPSTNVCVNADCDAKTHTCGMVDVAAGDPAAAGAQTQGDCKKVVCDGNGAPMSVNDDTDVPDDGEVCTDDSCSAGMPVHTPNSDACSENNGKVCGTPSGPKAGKCVACNVDPDCGGNAICQLNLCVTSSCNDEVQDNGETDVDCGGSCAPCADHDKCKVNADCLSYNCSLSDTCTPASCTDLVQNEGETDVDCGGPICGAEGKLCAAGKMCLKATDCQSANCDTVGHLCKAPTCIDGIQNEGETDIDCGGPSCGPCPNGKKCVGDSDCASMGCQVTSLTCVPQCTDGRKDGLETDIDCGGANACPRCVVNQGCALDGDCALNACDAISNKCVANQCADDRQDGMETDVDCGGGGACSACVLGRMCKTNTDCVSMGCQVTSLMCVPQCADGAQDGSETDVDCGGGTCPTCGSGLMCKVDTDCAATLGCQSMGLVCVTQCTDGHVDGNETDVDCGGGTCPGCGSGEACKVDTDCGATLGCQTPGLVCVTQCTDGHVDGNETDVDCGGGTCPACGFGLMCKVDTDCGSDGCDPTLHTCAASQCSDEQQDGNETDVDCGGGTCPGCMPGQMCKADSDCASNGCDLLLGTCATSQCTDGQQDGMETDLDCGGGTCPACGSGLMCKVDTDCAATLGCQTPGLVCVPQCADGHVDGMETGVDCGGSTCLSCANGVGCAVDADCLSNVCDLVSLLCVATECSDQQQDGAETDVDCGGGTCPGCGSGLMCKVDTDCSTLLGCDTASLTCALQCADGHVDGLETDVDCGGGTCPVCNSGEMCNVDSDCAATLGCQTASPHTCVDECADGHVDGLETDVDCGGGTCSACAGGLMCNVGTDCASGTCTTGLCD